MPRSAARNVLAGLLMAAACALAPVSALGQAMLADDIVILSQGVRARETAHADSALGQAAGAGGPVFANEPGSRGSTLGKTQAVGSSSAVWLQERDVLSDAAGQPQRGLPETVGPGRSASPRPQLPLFGSLEIPVAEPADQQGLTLDDAIESLRRQNFNLRAKFQEIPQADADILTAGLRGNPLIFASADNVPYGNFSPQRPGQENYQIVVIQPIDVNQKRQVRVQVAQRAKRVLQALYQDAVRLEIDALYAAYVDYLAARESVRFAQASVAGTKTVLSETQRLVKQQLLAPFELQRIENLVAVAELGMTEAEASRQQAARDLAVLIGLPVEAADTLSFRGDLQDRSPIDSPPEQLIAVARQARPDLVAYRLGIHRAQADVALARAERFPDVFVLYTPYGVQNNQPVGGLNATSWSMGGMASIPVFNRNQGNIARAQRNVVQSRLELADIDRRVESEVRNALAEYRVTRGTIHRYETEVLNNSRRIRDANFQMFRQGEQASLAFLNAQRDYNDVVRQYRDALVRHRRSMLRLNTAVGLRLLP